MPVFFRPPVASRPPVVISDRGTLLVTLITLSTPRRPRRFPCLLVPGGHHPQPAGNVTPMAPDPDVPAGGADNVVAVDAMGCGPPPAEIVAGALTAPRQR